MKKAIEVKNVVKKYDDKFELGPIDLEIPEGRIVGLIGENGAGKTTLIKTILNIIHSNEGTIKVFDKEIQKSESEIKEEIGVVLDNMFFPELLTPLDINSIMSGIYKKWDQNLFMKYMNDFSLPKKQMMKSMSKGMRKKLEIATALSHHPNLLILDEPTSGLDPVVRNEVLDLFLNFLQDEHHTILLSTHITSDLEHIADHIVFLDQGKIVLNKSRDEIIDHYGILKCDIDQFNTISKEDMICYKKNKYHYDILVNDKHKMSKKYKNFIIDNITLEELMVLMVKGVK